MGMEDGRLFHLELILQRQRLSGPRAQRALHVERQDDLQFRVEKIADADVRPGGVVLGDLYSLELAESGRELES
jgi:hypothetical protein